ncbi:PP2C family serine/threonine-protein phosphatase [Bacillus solitudinis]|uniref:PP2C family serine/threonine-protein phosphatase n=1 Tax=Bacillus solitudinis TaxID=2014074 RepID=UPI001D0D33A2|nr:PP2C family serine/threonine-protein phosphatase [Bacillus solitudinis]
MMIKHYSYDQIEIAAYQEAKSGKAFCGDAHLVIKTEEYLVCAVIDGLGSGEWANHSAEAAMSIIKDTHDKSVEEIVQACNLKMVNKRGVVLTIVKVDFERQELWYCNVGNIGFVLYQPDKTMVQPFPVRGYLSGRMQKVSSTCYRFQPGSAFVMYSDGVVVRPSNKMMLTMNSPSSQIDKFVEVYGREAKDDITLVIGQFR